MTSMCLLYVFVTALLFWQCECGQASPVPEAGESSTEFTSEATRKNFLGPDYQQITPRNGHFTEETEADKAKDTVTSENKKSVDNKDEHSFKLKRKVPQPEAEQTETPKPPKQHFNITGQKITNLNEADQKAPVNQTGSFSQSLQAPTTYLNTAADDPSPEMSTTESSLHQNQEHPEPTATLVKSTSTSTQRPLSVSTEKTSGQEVLGEDENTSRIKASSAGTKMLSRTFSPELDELNEHQNESPNADSDPEIPPSFLELLKSTGIPASIPPLGNSSKSGNLPAPENSLQAGNLTERLRSEHGIQLVKDLEQLLGQSRHVVPGNVSSVNQKGTTSSTTTEPGHLKTTTDHSPTTRVASTASGSTASDVATTGLPKEDKALTTENSSEKTENSLGKTENSLGQHLDDTPDDSDVIYDIISSTDDLRPGPNSKLPSQFSKDTRDMMHVATSTAVHDKVFKNATQKGSAEGPLDKALEGHDEADRGRNAMKAPQKKSKPAAESDSNSVSHVSRSAWGVIGLLIGLSVLAVLAMLYDRRRKKRRLRRLNDTLDDTNPMGEPLVQFQLLPKDSRTSVHRDGEP